MRSGLIAILAFSAALSAASVSAAETPAIAVLLDDGYEIIAVTDAVDRSVDIVYLKKGKSHVVCRYVPFSPDWTPLGESTCLPMNYATE